MRLRFGECVFDDEARQLSRAGAVVAVSPKAFRLLQILLDSRPRAVGKPQLHDQLWPETYVSHTSLPRLVSELRSAIGDDPRRPVFVRTVHGYGYAFSADATDDRQVEATAAGCGCGLLWAGRFIPLAEGESVIGRGADCAVRVPSIDVSRHHARIRVHGDEAVLEDLASKNGTFVGRSRILVPTALADGDEIHLGPAVMVYVAADASGSTRTRIRPSRDTR